MASHTSTAYSPDGLVVSADSLFSRSATIITGQVLARGAVLGKITASGKYNLSLSAAVDGSEVPVAILADAVDATGGDIVSPVYMGGFFDENKLVIGAAHTKASIFEQLRGVGIKLVSSISA